MLTIANWKVAVASEPEWEPALGEYGWLWILMVGVAIFTVYKLIQRRREQEDAHRRHEWMWGQREGESTEEWQTRVTKQEEDREKWKREREQKATSRQAQTHKRRSRGSVFNERGEFDPPGGWGGMGPG